MTAVKLNLVVAKKMILANGIMGFGLVDPEGKDLPAFTAGSHIDVYLANGLVRQYSLWNSPEERNRYCLGVLRDENGRGGSAAMHDDVAKGDKLTVSAPRNNFHLNEESGYSLLFAGGIGITPILAMAQRLLTLNKSFILHYCSRSKDRMAFHKILSRSPFKGRVFFHYDDGSKEQLLDASKELANYRNGSDMYVCGPQGFMDYVINAAEKSWPAGSIHREYFSIDSTIDHDDDESFEIKVASTGKIYQVPSDKSIVEVLAEHDIHIPVSCEQGVCGTCLTKVVSGEPDHRDVYLNPAEQAANDQMTICCSRSKSPMLELDI